MPVSFRQLLILPKRREENESVEITELPIKNPRNRCQNIAGVARSCIAIAFS